MGQQDFVSFGATVAGIGVQHIESHAGLEGGHGLAQQLASSTLLGRYLDAG